MSAEIKIEGGGVIVLGDGHSTRVALACALATLRELELICFRDSIDSHGNIVGGLICVRNGQLFPLDEAIIAEAIPPIRFELTRYRDEPPVVFYSSREDNRNRNELWKRSLRQANHGSKLKSKKR